MEVTFSKQWIHFRRSDRWPPTSTILRQENRISPTCFRSLGSLRCFDAKKNCESRSPSRTMKRLETESVDDKISMEKQQKKKKRERCHQSVNVHVAILSVGGASTLSMESCAIATPRASPLGALELARKKTIHQVVTVGLVHTLKSGKNLANNLFLSTAKTGQPRGRTAEP